jgi:DHA1 family bicyclomycin/chloramphenicol resistance-like MFS transporter
LKFIDQSSLGSARLTAVFALMASLAPLGMDSYLPAVQSFAQSLGVSPDRASWTLSNFLIGLGTGQLVGGALSDQKGRRRVALLGLLVYILSCLTIAFYHSLSVALAFRFLQGLGAGFMAVAGLAMIKDTTSAEDLAERLAMFFFIILLTPAAAPMLGSLILLLAPWPMIFLFCGGVASVMCVFVYFKVPETHHHSSGEVSLRAALNQYWYVLSKRSSGKLIAARMVLSGAMGTSVILVFVTTAPLNLMEHYGLSECQFPFAFACVIGAMLSGNRIGKWLLAWVPKESLFKKGLLFQFALVIAFLALSFNTEVAMPIYLGFIMLCVGTFTAVGPAGQAMYLNLLDKNFGSASALDQMLRFSSGGLLGGLALSLPFSPVQSVACVLLLSCGAGLLSFWTTRSYWWPKTAEL